MSDPYTGSADIELDKLKRETAILNMFKETMYKERYEDDVSPNTN